MFWTAEINPHDVRVNPGNGRAYMRVEDLPLWDYGDLVNALHEGPRLPSMTSFEIQWSRSSDRHRFYYPPEKWAAKVVFNSAHVSWQATNGEFMYEADTSAEQVTLFAEVGHERNGVFFPGA